MVDDNRERGLARQINVVGLCICKGRNISNRNNRNKATLLNSVVFLHFNKHVDSLLIA